MSKTTIAEIANLKKISHIALSLQSAKDGIDTVSSLFVIITNMLVQLSL